MKQYNGKEVILMACASCNASCKHCYVSYKGDMSSSELLKIVKKLKSKYDININGAEVLTNPEYLASYREINQQFVLSNGKVFLEDPSVIDKLKENGIKSVSISYHFGIQDDISPVKVSDLNKVIEILKNSGLEFRLLTTITSQNYKMLPYMCQTAHNLGARGIKFTNFIKQGNANNMPEDNVLSDSQIAEFFQLLLKERENYDKDDLLIERCGTFGKNYSSNNDHFYCDCISDSIVITPDNSVYPCVFLAKPGFEIGVYNDGKILVDETINSDHSRCLVREICNRNRKWRNK